MGDEMHDFIFGDVLGTEEKKAEVKEEENAEVEVEKEEEASEAAIEE